MVVPAHPRPLTGTPVGVYVHVPFCLRRCGYCAFNTYAVAGTDPTPRYARFLDGVRAELDLAGAALDGAPPVGTVYLGGGTPTLLGGDGVAAVLDAVRDRLVLADNVEITIEANPDTVDLALLAAVAEAGVDRISFGMQSADPAVLALLDRQHDGCRALAAVADARAAGIRSISLDLIAGTPGEGDASWRATVEAALSAQPDHLSVYSLSIEPATKLSARVRAGTLAAPDPDEQADRYLWTDHRLERAGYRWYEVSNWTRGAQHRCRHNLGYWRNHHWWGVGPGAHSNLAGRRWWNERDPDRWADLVTTGRSPVAGGEEPTPAEARAEDLLLGLRLAEGIPTAGLDAGAVARLEGDGLLERRGARVALTREGRLLADRVAVELW